LNGSFFYSIFGACLHGSSMKLLLPLLFSSASLFSASAQWIAPAGGMWSTAANWTSGGPPNGTGEVASFTSSVPGPNPSVLLDIPVSLGQITFDFTTDYTISPVAPADVFTFTQSSSSASAVIEVTASVGNGAHTIDADIALANNLSVSQGSTGIFTLNGILSGASRSLIKTGVGVLALTNASNSYSGGTSLTQGTISIINDGNLGSSGTTLTIGNAILQYAASVSHTRPFSLTSTARIDVVAASTATVMGLIDGSGSLTKGDAGILILTNTNTYSGGTNISAGTLSISSDGNLGDASGRLDLSGGTLNVIPSLTIPRSGSFSNASTITSGSSVTFTGNFNGAGSVTFSGGGTLTLVGLNSYTGGTTIATATQLAGTTDGLQGNIALADATSILSFSQNFNGTYGGEISGTGSLNKLGTGTVTFSGASTGFSGAATIQEGRLNVDGSLANASLLSVTATGTLGGSGTVGTTTCSGIISPGSSPGTLTIDGTLTFNPGSQVILEIAPLEADQIAVTGTATFLDVVPLTVDPTPGFYGFAADYTILTSAGLLGAGIPPGFSPVVSTNAAFVPSITSSLTDIFLHVDISEPFAVFPFSNKNTAAVGNNIDELFAAGQLSPEMVSIFNLFIGQSFAVINNALDQMHPALFSALVDEQIEVLSQLIQLFHRFPYLPCACANPNRFWFEPFGASLSVKQDGIEIGYQGNSGGFALGYDGEIAQNWVFGLGASWNIAHLHWHDSRGKSTINGLYGAAYTDYQWDSFYCGAALLSGIDFYDTDRNIQFLSLHRHAGASFHSWDVVGQIRSAYLFGSPQAFFYPYLNVDYLYLATEQVRERGAGSLNLKVLNRGDGTLRTEVGLALQVQDVNREETMCISPGISFGFVNMTPIQSPDYTAFFQNTTIPFKTEGWDKTWNLLHVDFGLSFAYKCFSLGLQYNIELSPDSETLYYNQHGNLSIETKW